MVTQTSRLCTIGSKYANKGYKQISYFRKSGLRPSNTILVFTAVSGTPCNLKETFSFGLWNLYMYTTFEICLK